MWVTRHSSNSVFFVFFFFFFSFKSCGLTHTEACWISEDDIIQSARSTAQRATVAPCRVRPEVQKARDPSICTPRPWLTFQSPAKFTVEHHQQQPNNNCKRPDVTKLRVVKTCRHFQVPLDRLCVGLRRDKFHVRIRFWRHGNRAITGTSMKSRTAISNNRAAVKQLRLWWSVTLANRLELPLDAVKTSLSSRKIRPMFTVHQPPSVNVKLQEEQQQQPRPVKVAARPSLAHRPCPKTANWWPAGSARRNASPSVQSIHFFSTFVCPSFFFLTNPLLLSAISETNWKT